MVVKIRCKPPCAPSARALLCLIVLGLLIGGGVLAQLQTSGGTGNITQWNGVAVSVGNGVAGTGTPRVTIASDNTAFTVNAAQSGAYNVGQSGTWTVQPGNTANTTAWLVKTVPLHGCAGNTLQDITVVDVATGAGSALTSADTCVFKLFINNKTASAVTVDIRDKQGTPVQYETAFSLTGNSNQTFDFAGAKFVSGVQIISGTASALNARLVGVQ